MLDLLCVLSLSNLYLNADCGSNGAPQEVWLLNSEPDTRALEETARCNAGSLTCSFEGENIGAELPSDGAY